MILRKWLLAGVLMSLATGVYAGGDATAGKAKAAVCMGCHGQNGVSVNPAWPNLAGQHAAYVSKQLADFKAGKRTDPVMGAQVAALSPQDMADVAAFFAGQKAHVGSADKAKLEMGQKIYRGGIKSKNIAACMACHGPSGEGNPTAKFPALSGQHAAYTAKTMKDFRSGTRANDPGNMMRDIASRMSDAEIDAVASYMQGLH